MKNLKYLVASALAATLLLTGCNEEDNRVSYNAGPLTEIKIPTVSFSGVLQDKNNYPIANHTVFIDDVNATTDANGIFIISGIKVKSGVHLGNADGATTNVLDGGTSTTTKVTIVIPDVEDNTSTTTHLGVTATISVEKYLAAVYNSSEQNFYTTLDGKVISTGVIQLSKLGASVSGRLEVAGTEESISGSMYMTMATESIGGANGSESNASDNGISIVSGNQQVYTATADANGTFTATGLPYNTTMKLLVSGYDENSSAFTTRDNLTAYNVGDITLTPVASGDNGNPEFSYIVGAYGDGNYTTGTTTQVGTFIRPSNTLTLKFTESIDSSKVSTGSVRYVKTYTDEYLEAWSLVNSYDMNKTNALNSHLNAIDTFRDANATFVSYLNTHSGSDMNVSSTNFKNAYQAYYTALKAMIDDANTTYGSDEITAQNLAYFKLADGVGGIVDNDINVSSTGVLSVNPAIAGTVTAAQVIADLTGTIAGDYGLLAYTSTEVGLLHEAAIGQMNGVNTKEKFYTVSSVAVDSADASKVTITLGSTLDSSNVVTIGLVLFDFTDSSGNILTETRTNGVDLVNDNDITYVLQVAAGTAQ